jgi:poly-gamma-glutamate synthesis protein (capsule biosynthesis protein)
MRWGHAGRQGAVGITGILAVLVVMPLVTAADHRIEPPVEPPVPDGPTAAAARAERSEQPPRDLLVVAGGDVLHEGLVNQAGAAAAAPGERYDFAAVFAPVAPVVAAADLAICHVETPIGRPGVSAGVYGRSPFGGNLLLAPAESAAGLAATGFDRCSTASNHANDLGRDGIASTIEVLDAAGISHAGTARTPAEAEVEVFTVDRVRVAHLAYSTYSNTPWPSDRWALLRASDPVAMAADVDRARRDGAEVVIVSIHVSRELTPGPIPADRELVTRLTALARVDLVVMHGPHVVHPIEEVNGALVHWSLGNFVSAMGRGNGRYASPATSDGLLARVRFTETAPGRFTVTSRPVAICNERATRTVLAPSAELSRLALTGTPLDPDRSRQLQACLTRVQAVVPDAT